MIDYQTFCQIRQLRDDAHLNLTQIADQLGLHWQTVSKWEKRSRYGRRQSAPAERRVSKLEAFKPAIQRLLSAHAYSAIQLFARGFKRRRGLTFDTQHGATWVLCHCQTSSHDVFGFLSACSSNSWLVRSGQAARGAAKTRSTMR